MRRHRIAILVLLAALLLAPAVAQAHPLGNFSVNHIAFVRISEERVDVRYVLDQAEIPTFQERGRATAAILAAKRAEVLRHLRLRVDGRPVVLALGTGGRIDFPPGQGGLRTTRIELRLRAAVDRPRRVALEDRTFDGRVGWKDIVVLPGGGTDVRSNVPATEPTRDLRLDTGVSDQRHEHLADLAKLPTPPAHVAADLTLRNLRAVLLNETLPDPPRRVTPLARRLTISLDPPVDHRPERPELGRRPRHRRTLRRRHRALQCLADRPPMNAMAPRELPDRQTLTRVIAPDRLKLLHPRHSSRPFASR
jgi:hypothetical protein